MLSLHLRLSVIFHIYNSRILLFRTVEDTVDDWKIRQNQMKIGRKPLFLSFFWTNRRTTRRNATCESKYRKSEVSCCKCTATFFRQYAWSFSFSSTDLILYLLSLRRKLSSCKDVMACGSLQTGKLRTRKRRLISRGVQITSTKQAQRLEKLTHIIFKGKLQVTMSCLMERIAN